MHTYCTDINGPVGVLTYSGNINCSFNILICCANNGPLHMFIYCANIKGPLQMFTSIVCFCISWGMKFKTARASTFFPTCSQSYLTNISTPVSSILLLIPFQDCFIKNTCLCDSPSASLWGWAMLENWPLQLGSIFPLESGAALSLTFPALVLRQPIAAYTWEQ